MGYFKTGYFKTGYFKTGYFKSGEGETPPFQSSSVKKIVNLMLLKIVPGWDRRPPKRR